MILVIVGTQFAFDRLVRAVDEWATLHGRDDVVAQIGPSTYQARTIKTFDFLEPERFGELQRQADAIVSHAGMGSILTAMQRGKPIIIMPRVAARGEHRNEHQKMTAQRFRDIPGVYVADDESALAGQLDRIGDLAGNTGMTAKAPAEFTARLRAFIDR